MQTPSTPPPPIHNSHVQPSSSSVSGKPKGHSTSKVQSKKSQSTNSFSILYDKTNDCDKKNLPPKRIRKPTIKVAKALDKGIKGLSKGTEDVSKKKKFDPKGAGHSH